MIRRSQARATACSVAMPLESGTFRSQMTRSNCSSVRRASASRSVPTVCTAGAAQRICARKVVTTPAQIWSSSSSRMRTCFGRGCSALWGKTMDAPAYFTAGGNLPAASQTLTFSHNALQAARGLRAAGHQPFRQLVAEGGDIARARPPHPAGLAMAQAMAQRVAQAARAEGVAEHMRVHRDVHDQRMALALLGHLVELVDDHVAEVGVVLLAVHHDLGVIELYRVGHRKKRPGARAQPH